ncbi:MAG: AhpC/TSA family protein [Mucilaginibacter polytrichastri]|nr:AhpC/TSA family protein [Mucilaginibacter polytrichastri]
MKKLTALLFGLFFASCAEERPFIIEGFAPHLDEGFAYIRSGEYMELTDSFPIVDHRFSFSKKIKEPTFYNIVFSGREEGNPHDYQIIRNVWLESGSTLKLNLGAVASPEMQLEKGDVQFEYEHLRKSKADILEYVKTHPESYVAIKELQNYLVATNDTATAARLLLTFSPEIRQSASGTGIINYIARERMLREGGEAPDFTQENRADGQTSLSELRGKYVLLDFWASWCHPCRIEHLERVKTYRKYQPKGFEIISVSLDERKPDWLKAIRDDKLNWQHVSDLRGFSNVVARQYHIRTIPENFLLDKNGKIIARNLHGKELEKKLGELLDKPFSP